MMKDNFRWSRFGQVLWYDIKNIWPRFGITMLCLALVPVVLYLLSWLFTGLMGAESVEVRSTQIGLFTFLVVIMAPSRLYKNSNVSGSGMYFAMLPASKLEKYISMLLVTIVICPLIFLLGSFVIDTVLWTIGLIDGCDSDTIWSVMGLLWYEGSMIHLNYPTFATGATMLMLWGALTTYLDKQSIFLFTSTIFKTHKVTKTILWLLLIGFVVSVVVMPLMLALGLNFSEQIAMYVEGMTDSELEYLLENMALGTIVTILIVQTLFAVGLYVWTGFRLKNMKY